MREGRETLRKAVRKSVLGAVVLWFGVLAGQVMACQAPAGAEGIRDGVIAWMNAERKAKGLEGLRASGTLQNSATNHACDMAGRDFFAHEGPGGPSLTQRLRKVGYRFRAANENIAKTSTDSVERVAEIWRKSPGHMVNVLDPKVREVGIGLALGDGKIYWVTNSGTK